jgi:hypothetical protein
LPILCATVLWMARNSSPAEPVHVEAPEAFGRHPIGGRKALNRALTRLLRAERGWSRPCRGMNVRLGSGRPHPMQGEGGQLRETGETYSKEGLMVERVTTDR